MTNHGPFSDHPDGCTGCASFEADWEAAAGIAVRPGTDAEREVAEHNWLAAQAEQGDGSQT